MSKFLITIFLVFLTLIFVQVVVVLGLRASPPAEYWVAQLISVKEALADAEPAPRTLVLGGSSSLFGVSAEKIERATGRPTINMGLHAGLRLDKVLAIGRQVAKPGDLIILTLEPGYLTCGADSWSSWQVRNAVAWDRDYFTARPLKERVEAVLSAGDPNLPVDMVSAWLGARFHAKSVMSRVEALDPAMTNKDLSSIRRGLLPKEFVYSADNLNANGDIGGTDRADYFGDGFDRTTPGHICAGPLKMLGDFNRDMKSHNIRVVAANVPYLVRGSVPADWVNAEQAYRADLASAGIDLVDSRQDVFFPPEAFFNSAGHLNAHARDIRTEKLLVALYAKGLLHAGG